MKNHKFDRAESMLGEEFLDILNKKRVIIFGLGGVGGYCLEGLIRGGIQNITIVDGDVIDETNINRQILATEKTIGMPKVEVAKSRAYEINSDIEIESIYEFYKDEKYEMFKLDEYDYIIDAIDDVKAKISLAYFADKSNIPMISSMGTGNKLNATSFKVDSIHNTSVCPLAKKMRKELKKIGVTDLKVVYSNEEPIKKISPPGSISFIPPIAGFIMAGEVIKDLIND